MVQQSSQHALWPVKTTEAQLILVSYQDGKEKRSDFESWFIVGAQTVGAGLAGVSIVNKVTSAFRSLRKTPVNSDAGVLV